MSNGHARDVLKTGAIAFVAAAPFGFATEYFVGVPEATVVAVCIALLAGFMYTNRIHRMEVA